MALHASAINIPGPANNNTRGIRIGIEKIKRNNKKIFQAYSLHFPHYEWWLSCKPGHPKGFKGLKWFYVYYALHSQHHS